VILVYKDEAIVMNTHYPHSMYDIFGFTLSVCFQPISLYLLLSLYNLLIWF
jgi:hypothetical protein